MKNLFSIAIISLFTFSFFSCGSGEENTPQSTAVFKLIDNENLVVVQDDSLVLANIPFGSLITLELHTTETTSESGSDLEGEWSLSNLCLIDPKDSVTTQSFVAENEARQWFLAERIE